MEVLLRDELGDMWAAAVGRDDDQDMTDFTPEGRCRLTVSKLELKARLVSALETENVTNCFQTLLSVSTCAATTWRLLSKQSSKINKR